MTVEQLIADLQLYPDDLLVVFESVERVVVITAVSSSPVHANDELTTVARHTVVACRGCERDIPIVRAVSLLGREIREIGSGR